MDREIRDEVGLYVVFDGPPDHNSGRFVELENHEGYSIGPDTSGAEWREEENGLWSLGPFSGEISTLRARLAEVEADLHSCREALGVAQTAEERTQMELREGEVLVDKDSTIRWDYVVRCEPWENDDYVITIRGKPIGQSLARRDAKLVARWLPTAMDEIVGIANEK